MLLIVVLLELEFLCLLFTDTVEALTSLKVAMEMKAQGKGEKAMRLFKHAMALAPRHPEVLNRYGEYLEHSRSDIVTADLLYFQVCFFFVSLPIWSSLSTGLNFHGATCTPSINICVPS